MPALHVFEYAVIRVVPRVEREEFINAGVVVYCPRLRFLQARISLDEDKLLALCPGTDVELVRASLQSFEHICRGGAAAGPIGLLDMPSRFRWLTATRSTMLQASKVHPGLTADAAAALERLFCEQVR
jgi:hypothetical protein